MFNGTPNQNNQLYWCPSYPFWNYSLNTFFECFSTTAQSNMLQINSQKKFIPSDLKTKESVLNETNTLKIQQNHLKIQQQCQPNQQKISSLFEPSQLMGYLNYLSYANIEAQTFKNCNLFTFPQNKSTAIGQNLCSKFLIKYSFQNYRPEDNISQIISHSNKYHLKYLEKTNQSILRNQKNLQQQINIQQENNDLKQRKQKQNKNVDSLINNINYQLNNDEQLFERRKKTRFSQSIQHKIPKNIKYKQIDIEQQVKSSSERNLCSNTLKYFSKYIQKYSVNKKKIQSIISYYQMKNYTSQRFFAEYKSKMKRCKNYIRPKFVQKLCCQTENFSIIFRILLRIFLKHEKSIFIPHCKKLQLKAKTQHLLMARKLNKKLFGNNQH